ncbi:hypothetical protein FRB96_001791 [Tulasnella sp. 330]|nr:hypothetical protein FRB96_001791 [Tulasnella sp. 330]KAG8886978.1 hypothetical protein FRB98_000702 [Tulasnella sp. 332]
MPCGTCVRSHAHAQKLDPLTTPADFECTYDNPEEAAEAPSSKINRLQARIAELEQIVQTQEAQLSACVCHGRDPTVLKESAFQAASDTYDMPLFPQTNTAAPTIIVSPMLSSSQSPELDGRYDWESSPLISPNGSQTSSASPSSENATLSTEIWPLNIPPPELLYHLAETVFAAVPLANRVLHRPTFMASLAYPPSSHEFPHVNLLHAICALASIYTPIVTDVASVDPEADLHEGAAAVFSSGVMNRKFNDSGPRYFPRRPEDFADPEDQDFAAVHLKWCWVGMRIAVRRGDALIQQAQGVNISPELRPISRVPQSYLYNLDDPKTPQESETRRNLFWAVYSTERLFNAFNVWPGGFEDVDCSQILPCRFKDFEAGRYVPPQGRQRILSHNTLITHPKLTTDSFALYVKATVVLGKVKYFNRTFRYRHTDGEEASRVSDNIGLDSAYKRPSNNIKKPQGTDEFKALESLIEAFIANIPKEFRDPVGLNSGAKLDPLLYMTHMIPHMAIITLHDPHADVFSLGDVSAQKILAGARAILELIYKVCATTYDLIYLDHSSSKAWFLAGITLIRFLCARTVQNDDAEVARLTQELGAIKCGLVLRYYNDLTAYFLAICFRFILGNLGDRTRIGLRQIKLLEHVYMMEMAAAQQSTQTTITQPATLQELSP